MNKMMKMMNIREMFENIMINGTAMAFASSVDNVPNVRILNYIYSNDEKIMYFQSFKGSPKEKEFEKNQNVAFTTIPPDGIAFIRTNQATVKKSEKTIFDLQNAFIEKMPFYKELIEHNGNSMDLYEVHFSNVEVWSNPDKFERLQV